MVHGSSSQDASDLPLLEIHTSFNTALLTFAAIEDVEEECDVRDPLSFQPLQNVDTCVFI